DQCSRAGGSRPPASCSAANSFGSWRAVVWRDAPSWLVSAVLHLSALILLGLVYFHNDLAQITQLTGAWTAADSGPSERDLAEPEVSLNGFAAEETAKGEAAAEPVAALVVPALAGSSGSGAVTIGGVATAPRSKPDPVPRSQPLSLAGAQSTPPATIQPSA